MGDLLELRERCKDPADANDLYRICEEAGFHFGPTFRRVQEVRLGPSYEATYTVTIPDTLSCMPDSRQSDYIIHPISLDVVFQGATLFLAQNPNPTEGPYMPISIEEITVAVGMIQEPGSSFRVHATSTPPDAFSRRRSFNYVVLDTQRASHPTTITILGVIESPVQGVEIAQERSESRCLRIRWEPSMSYLNQDDSEAMLSLLPPKPHDPQASRKLEKMGIEYIKQALHQTNFDELPATYVRKLYAWMESKLYEANGNNTNNKAHEANNDVFRSEVPIECIDDTPHGLKEDLNGARVNNEAVVKANGDISNSKADITLIEHHDDTSSSHSESTQLTTLMMHRVADQLPAILQGQIDPAVLMSEDDIDRFKAKSLGMSRLYSATATYIQKLAFQSPVLRM